MDRVRVAMDLLREDVALMKVGKLKCTSHGFDVTPEHMRRLEIILDKLGQYEGDRAYGRVLTPIHRGSLKSRSGNSARRAARFCSATKQLCRAVEEA